MEHRQGLLMVFTGRGKGKTTAALGAALRAAGTGQRVRVIQFIKRGQGYGELKSLAAVPGIEVSAHGLGLIGGDPDLAPHRAKAGEGLATARQALADGRYDLVILDEICVALAKGLLEKSEVLELVRARPRQTHLIMTGRECPPEILSLADTVTEMREIKHHLAAGVPAQEGVEY